MPLDILNFVRKWQASTLTERSAYQQHFRDLCEALDVPHPTEQDTDGNSYTFEKHIPKTGTDEKGFADVWKRRYFAWEYKSKGGDLKAAYRQINQYHEALENPPLLIVCDFDRFEVHTKFENLPTRVYAFTLEDLLHPERDTPTSAIPPLEVLRHVFDDYNQLRPNRTSARVTEAAAADFLRLAQQIELERAAHPLPYTKEQIAHFLMRLVFCLFADSVKLIPNHAFRRLIANDRFSPTGFNKKLPTLFDAMSSEGGFFGADNIPYFNGGLFTDNTTIPLNHADLGILYSAAQHDWSHIEPSIFGTLFERSLDAAKRSLIGAHYTSPDDILLLVEPVVMQPLYRRWAEVQKAILAALAQEETSSAQPPPVRPNIPQSTETSANGATTYQPGPKPESSLGPTSTSSRPEAAHLAAGVERPLYSSVPRATSPAVTPKARPIDARAQPAPTVRPKRSTAAQTALRLNRPALELLQNWAAELSSVRVLDPACGSGNFLYITLKRLLDLWHEARVFGIHHGLTIAVDPMPNPAQLFGIETDFYAHEIASVVVWIGFLQWKHDHGVEDHKSPLLRKLTNIEHGDAIMRHDETDKSPEHPSGKPYEPTWPEAEYIVGNPPFLGGKLLRRELGDAYVDALFDLYRGRVKAESDLVVYWFEKARHQLETETVTRVGLLATQGIRGGANRAVLERIQQTGTIFWAWSDRKWMLHGAAVHVSMVAFEREAERPPISEPATDQRAGDNTSANGAALYQPGVEPGSPASLLAGVVKPQVSESPQFPRAESPSYLLDGQPVPSINPDLTTGSNTSAALRLNENEGICFMGTTKVGPFDIDAETAHKMLAAPLNPNSRPNSDVVRPWVNALDITRRPRNMFIIDFGTDTTKQAAALYQIPFEYLKHHVKPVRQTNNRETYAAKWWIHGEPRSELRKAIRNLKRYIVTPSVAKHRMFQWLGTEVVPDHAVFIFARDDDYFFGVLHSTAHELWALTRGTQLESRPRYTPDSTFDTFPFPWPPDKEPKKDSRVEAIAAAARELVAQRDRWLNPPDISDADLKKRTLTNLYNDRQAGKMTWLDNLHRTLDEAIFSAYGWPPNISDSEILSRLLALNHERATAPASDAKTVSSKV